jgi:hypothetical protein
MPNTPLNDLPYPVLSDTPDVPRDIQALAVKLDGILSFKPPIVTTLPASPVDSQEVYFVADAATRAIWHLRYNAGSASSYKWEFLGGAPQYGSFLASQNGTAGAWTAAEPSIAVARPGDYLFTFSATAIPTVTGIIGCCLYVGGIQAVTEAVLTCAAGEQFLGRADVPFTVAAGIVQLGVYSAAAFSNRYLSFRPVRIA